MKFPSKYIHLLLALIISGFIIFMYSSISIINVMGIFPWFIIEVIWFYVIKINYEYDQKILNLLFASLFLFTFLLPLLELYLFKTSIFAINKYLIGILNENIVIFILYIMLTIFILLYWIICFISFLNINHFEGKSSKNIENENIDNENINISYNISKNSDFNKKHSESIILKVPKIDIKPYDIKLAESVNTKNEEGLLDENIINDANDTRLDIDDEKTGIYENYDLSDKQNESLEVGILSDIENKRGSEIIESISKPINNNIYSNVNSTFNDRLNIDDLIPESMHTQRDNFEENNEIIEEKAVIILKTLKDFGIESTLIQYIKGPVVTRFELEVDEKVNLGKILKLEKNIAYNLSAERIRIIAPIPGKKAVGIEIPNDIKKIVYFTDLVKTDDFKKCKQSGVNLPFILGKDIEGKVIIADISKMPHLLIAGRTGSGKSVCINTLIASLVLANSPDEVKLILIDPKRVELSLYDELPHLLTDEIIIYPEDASSALKWLVNEMENRYNLLKESGFRSIEDYNANNNEKLPYLVLIIDEFYALMQTAQKIIEDSLIHLSAMARAVGIHLIFATQRPSAEVITGVIKSNLPSRIAFQTFSKTDSRIILDVSGAESLLGNGDMLFSFAGMPPVRIQGAFISTSEVRSLVKNIALKFNSQRKSINTLFANINKEENTNDQYLDFDDPLYKDAIEIVKKERKASASYLQRRLKIGYNRAARMIEKMEEEGLISDLIDGKRREIYI